MVLLLLAVGLQAMAEATGDGDERCSAEYPINVNVLLDSSTASWSAHVSGYVSSVTNVSIDNHFSIPNSILKEYYVEENRFHCVMVVQMKGCELLISPRIFHII